MNTLRVPSLRNALAEVAGFRQTRGRRYELLSALLLCGVAVMRGYRSPPATAEWGAKLGGQFINVSRPQTVMIKLPLSIDR